jgi:hypothetical protein
MKKAWRVILVIFVICLAVGAVSAGVGVLTGADFERIGAALSDQIAEKYNYDANAIVHEWIPQSVQIVENAIF